MWNVVKPRNIFHLKASSVFLSDTLHLEVWWIDKPSKNKNKRQSGSKQSKKKSCWIPCSWKRGTKLPLTSRWAWISPKLPVIQLSEFQISSQMWSIQVSQQSVQKGCPEIINGNYNAGQLDHSRKQSKMDYSAQTTFEDLQTNEAKMSGWTLRRENKTVSVSNT